MDDSYSDKELKSINANVLVISVERVSNVILFLG